MSAARAKCRELLFELIERLRPLSEAGPHELEPLAAWIAEHWSDDPDFLNEVSMLIARPQLDFEVRAELFDRLYQCETGPGCDAAFDLVTQGKHWDPQMTGVVAMIDTTHRLRDRVCALPDRGHHHLERSLGTARVGVITGFADFGSEPN